jgi:hypothetical protein
MSSLDRVVPWDEFDITDASMDPSSSLPEVELIVAWREYKCILLTSFSGNQVMDGIHQIMSNRTGVIWGQILDLNTWIGTGLICPFFKGIFFEGSSV